MLGPAGAGLAGYATEARRLAKLKRRWRKGIPATDKPLRGLAWFVLSGTAQGLQDYKEEPSGASRAAQLLRCTR
jgi:hypothetical protein